MAKKKEPIRPDRKSNPFLRFGGMVFQMLTIILLAALGGHWLDGHYQTEKPYWTLGCAFTGVIVSMVIVIKDINRPA